jgi:diguanylate cyclase (GGDEF)-like protein
MLPLVALTAASVVSARAADSAVLTSLRAIRALNNAEARRGVPVAFSATVEYSRGYEHLLFVEDGNNAIFVQSPGTTTLKPGDRVHIKGQTQESFNPIVIAESITVMSHGAVPAAIPTTFTDLIRSRYDCHLVTIRARVRAADMVTSSFPPVRSGRLELLTDSGHIEANVDSSDENALKSLLDAQVEVTGAAAGMFNDKMEQTGVVLYISSLSNIKVLTRASVSPWSLPVTPMDQILANYRVQDLTPRVRVHGVITFYQPGLAVVLQDGPKSLWIATHTREPLQIGDLADATGFPDAHERLLTLSDGEIRDSHIAVSIKPQPATWKQLAFWSSNLPTGHLYDLVSIEGRVVTEVHEAAQDEYIVNSGGRLFTAIYRHPTDLNTPPMLKIPEGSKVRVTGICMVADPNAIIPDQEVPFNILLRSYSDLAVVAGPTLLSVRNLSRLVALLLMLVLIASVWGWRLERKVHHQASAMAARIEAESAQNRRMAQLEQRRSRILEGVNSSQPLAQIVEQITEMVSFSLNGSPCWCTLADGARLGKFPAETRGLRISQREITAHSGAALGTIFVAFDTQAAKEQEETQALATGARLTALAIETRRLYTDLVHRSEFDPLTDVHNRFSLDRHLEELINKASAKGSIFGLIYVDLDKFKEVNDLYGHRVGDLYLQEASLRMKRQLRKGDMLARLGGDEFAVLVPVVRNRTDVKEIALRLEHCFDTPFTVGDYTLYGSASVGVALFPEDGTTSDSLLCAADDAMYVAKNRRRPHQIFPVDLRDIDLPSSG